MAITERYQPGGTVFAQWQIAALISVDAAANCASFRLSSVDDSNVQCVLQVVTIMQEAVADAGNVPMQLWEAESRRNFCKETAARSIRQNFEIQDCPYLLPCLECAFLDWQEGNAFGCDMLIRTPLAESLRSRMERGYSFAETAICRIGSDLCAALSFLHGKQLLHRSIRPENIYFSPEGICMLGPCVASDVHYAFPGTGVFAPRYCAPEQLQNLHYPVSDLYSLGLVLYELANGSLPFADAGQNENQAISTRLQGYPIPQPRHTGDMLAGTILRACAPDPALRYQSAAQLLDALCSGLRAVPVPQPVNCAPVPQMPAGEERRQPPVGVSRQPETAAQRTHPARRSPAHTDDGEEPGSKVILIVRTVIITLLLLLALGVGLFFYLKMQSSDAAIPATQPPQMHSTTPSPAPTAAPPAATEAPEETEAEPTLPESHSYYSCYNPYTEFVLPDSDVRYYAPAQLQNFTDKQLEVALAEIYARHGVTPSNAVLADYFRYLSWFAPSSAPYTLSEVEENNALLIETLQKKRSGTMNQYVNPYMPYFHPDAYFMEASSTRYLTSEDLRELSQSELSLALNEIFARHGYIFGKSALLEYFYCTNWYTPTYTREEFTYNYFSKEESANIDLILVYLDIADYSGPRKDNPYIQYLGYSGFVIPNSSVTRLRESDLEALNDTQLYLAEMEIYARYGLAFADTDLQHYFLSCTWYTVEFGVNRTSRIPLTDVEQANLELIRAYRESR